LYHLPVETGIDFAVAAIRSQPFGRRDWIAARHANENVSRLARRNLLPFGGQLEMRS
jgi:hypothetical protein